MLIFLDETFRTHKKTGNRLGVLSGVAVPEDAFHSLQSEIYHCRRPYHGQVLKPDDEMHGTHLLNNTTRRMLQEKGYSYHYNLVEDVLSLARSRGLRVFGVACFRSDFSTFVCADETKLDLTYRYLFERIDNYMRREFPDRIAKLVFDNRDHKTDERNARAITNFFMRSRVGVSYDSILRVPFFALSQGHNYGLQLADLVTTVLGLRFQGYRWLDPLWRLVQGMLYEPHVGGLRQSSLKVMRDWS